MLGGGCFNNVGLLRPVQVRKLPLFIDFENFLGVGMNQHQRRYWISPVFVLSLAIIACDICRMVFVIGMYHSPSNRFQCPFNINL